MGKYVIIIADTLNIVDNLQGAFEYAFFTLKLIDKLQIKLILTLKRTGVHNTTSSEVQSS